MTITIKLTRQFLKIHNPNGDDWNLTKSAFQQIKEEDYYHHRMSHNERGECFSVFDIVGIPIAFIQLGSRQWILWQDKDTMKRCTYRQHKTTDNLPHITLANMA